MYTAQSPIKSTEEAPGTSGTNLGDHTKEPSTSSPLLEQLHTLPFPPQRSMDPSIVESVLSIPWRNNTKPLTETTSRGRKTTVKSETLKEYQDWLVTSNDGCWCKLCKLFVNPSTLPIQYGKFLTKPWTSYGRKQDLADHSLTKYHQSAVLGSGDYVAIRLLGTRKPIDEQLDIARARDVKLKKGRLYSIIKCMVFCARQNISVRGHDKERVPLISSNDYRDGIILGDVNRGNFMQLMELRREAGDHAIDSHINKKALYTSPGIQNELLARVSSQVMSKVLSIVSKCRYFAIIDDETRDVSNTEQLCVALRYYDAELKTSNEQFMAFVPLESLKGEALAAKILQCLEELGVDMRHCVGQAYDGASNMSGKRAGCASLITQKYPLAVYTHCKSHILNLALVKACTSLVEIRKMMDTQSELCSFFSNSAKKQQLLEKILRDSDEVASRKTKLSSLSKTRWVERYTALDTTVELLPFIGEAIQHILDSALHRGDEATAEALKNSIMKFGFIYVLVVCCQVLSVTKALCVSLEGRSNEVVNASQQITRTLDQLKEYRQHVDRYSSAWYKQASELATSLKVTPSITRRCGRQTTRSNIPANSPQDYYLRSVTIPFLDLLISEYEDRFSSAGIKALELLHIMPVATASSDTDQWIPLMKEAVKPYIDYLPSPHTLETELIAWQHLWLGKDIEGVADNLASARDAASVTFPNIYELLCIISALPVTSCEAERAFSKLKLIKTAMRSTMSHERLNSIAVISIHRQVEIELEPIVTKFLGSRTYKSS